MHSCSNFIFFSSIYRITSLKQYSQYGKKLTETDKKRLEKLGEEKEFSEVIRYMLEKNIKLEQECIIE
jgi:ribonuclease PH